MMIALRAGLAVERKDWRTLCSNSHVAVWIRSYLTSIPYFVLVPLMQASRIISETIKAISLTSILTLAFLAIYPSCVFVYDCKGSPHLSS